MRKDLTSGHSELPQLKPPPLIHPEAKKAKLPLVTALPAEKPSETVYVLRVQPDYRTGCERLNLLLSRADNKQLMPKLKIRPGMIIKVTVIKDPAGKKKTEAENA